MPDLLTLAQQLRDSLENQSDSEFARLSAEFQDMVDRLEGDIDALSKDIATGAFTANDVEELESYRRLIRDADSELEEYSDFLAGELALTAGLWLSLGATNSDLLMAQAAADAGVEITLTPMEDGVLAALNDYLEDGSPLSDKLLQYGVANAERIKQIIIQSVTLGLNPREIARKIVAEGFGMALTEALRMTRTLQLYAYRQATLENYRRNSDVITGWVWFSALIPGRTCMSCVSLHGSEHTLDEVLNDHYNGLCTMLPLIEGNNPVKTDGETWFESQSKAVQIAMMGQLKWQAWQDGKIKIGDMSGIRNDPVYGDMRYERSLRELLQ